MGHGPAGQSRARPARNHGRIQCVAGAQHGLHLVFSLGQGHGQGAFAVGGQPVAFVGHRVLRRVQQRVGRQDRAQCTDHLGLPGGPVWGLELAEGGEIVHRGASLGQGLARMFEKTFSGL